MIAAYRESRLLLMARKIFIAGCYAIRCLLRCWIRQLRHAAAMRYAAAYADTSRHVIVTLRSRISSASDVTGTSHRAIRYQMPASHRQSHGLPPPRSFTHIATHTRRHATTLPPTVTCCQRVCVRVRAFPLHIALSCHSFIEVHVARRTLPSAMIYAVTCCHYAFAMPPATLLRWLPRH